MIKVTTKEGITFEADDSKSAFYNFFGAKIETIETKQIINHAPKKVGRKKLKK